MSDTAKGLIGWAILLAVIGGTWFYWSHQKPKSTPAAQAAKPNWALEKYDSGKFYFREDFMTEYRAVCDSNDCTSLLDNTEVGLLGQLDDVKRENLHLTVRQKGHEYRFRVEAMGPLRVTSEPILWIAIVKFDARMPLPTVQHL